MNNFNKTEARESDFPFKGFSKQEKPRILIVDDEESLLLSLSDVISISFSNFDILTSASAEEALETLEQQPIDLVITDLKLPAMDGLELTRNLHSLVPEIPIILITAYGNNNIHYQAQKNGCLAYLEKPFDIDLLIKHIERGLRQNNKLIASKNEKKTVSRLSSNSLSPLISNTNIFLSSKDKETTISQSFPHRPSLNSQDLTDPELSLPPEEQSLFSSAESSSLEQTKYLQALVNRGIKNFREHKLFEAKRCWEEALSLNANCAEAKHNLSILEVVLRLKNKF